MGDRVSEVATRRQAIGAIARRARTSLLDLTIDEAAARAPMSPVTWGNFEAGYKVKPFSIARIERVLGWPPGSVEHFMSTGEGEEALLAGTPAASRPALTVDDVLGRNLPDAIKVLMIKALRSDREPVDAVLLSDAPDRDKVAAIRALRDLQPDADDQAAADPAGTAKSA